jgi:hypothetical protein
MMQAGLADALRQRGHAVAEPVEIVFPRQRRTRDPVTNLGVIASMGSVQRLGGMAIGSVRPVGSVTGWRNSDAVGAAVG